MKNLLTAATAAPAVLLSTPQKIEERYDEETSKNNEALATNARAQAKLKKSLAVMSKELYGREEFTLAKSWLNHVLWLAALLVVATLEIPTNSGGFEIFNRSQNQTTAMAVFFGVIIAILSHFTGFSFKRAVAEKKYGQNTGSFTRGIIFLIVAGSMLWFIAGFRVSYMLKMGFEQEISQFTQAGFAMGIFFVGAIASFFHTSAVKELELEKTFKNELNSLRKLISQSNGLIDNQKKLDIETRGKYEQAEDAITAKEESLVQVQKDQEQKELEVAKKAEEAETAKIVEAQKKGQDFLDLQQKLNSKFSEATKLFEGASSKKKIQSNHEFITAKAEIESLIEDMEQLGVEVAGSSETIASAKEMLNTLNATK